ncbi:MAG: hypothetical protein JST76_14320, partial [Bacteroidetes bacterium]|nr:hypothetical protein [Bacteroidota bacterium]
GYVILYHKYETFWKTLFNRIYVDEKGLKDDCERLGLFFASPDRNPKKRLDTRIECIKEIEWICNSVKHKGGYAKDKSPDRYSTIDISKPIPVNTELFTIHIDFMFEYYLYIAQFINGIFIVRALNKVIEVLDTDIEKKRFKSNIEAQEASIISKTSELSRRWNILKK